MQQGLQATQQDDLLIARHSSRQDVLSRNEKESQQTVLPLVRKLCQTLEAEKINYCHWKSNEALSRSASGENDLDLLVSRTDAERFHEILFRLGFRQAQENEDSRLPGILNYYGYDAAADRLIHVHLHYQLVLGNDLSKNYHIPVERAYLYSARQVGLFRVPAPEFELVIFVIRMVLKHRTWDSILIGRDKLSSSERRELAYLATPETLADVGNVLQYLPYVDKALFDTCLRSLQPGCALLNRVRTGEQLQSALEACARRPHARDIIAKLLKWALLIVRVGIFRQRSGRRLANGGLLIAVVGGDGSGKTTAIDGIQRWLSKKFDLMRLHMGKPAWSRMTLVVFGLLKIARLLGLYSREENFYGADSQFPGYPWLLQRVCVARDRYLTYLKARRFASNGGLVILDRYPLPTLAMDAPQCARAAKTVNQPNAFLNWLIGLEASYYRKITTPDLLIVLRVDPDVAVQRKPEESARSVHARSMLVWQFNWAGMPAYVLDAGLSREEVLAQIKSIVWEHL